MTIHLSTRDTPILGVGETYNLGVTYSSSTLTITAADGSALSTSNVGYVGIPSTTAGIVKTMPITSSNHFFIDDGGSSDIVGEEFGWTTGVAVGSATPFFIYACMEDSDAAVKFALSPNPCATVVPATANCGYHANPGATPSQNNFFFMNATDPTTAYDTNPCTAIGAINMKMSAADDWTVQTLDSKSGIGQHCINGHCATLWTMPVSQNGAASGKYFTDNGGTAPGGWSTNNLIRYLISRDGQCRVIARFNGGDPNGAGAVTAQCAAPYKATSVTNLYYDGCAFSNFNGSTDEGFFAQILHGTSLIEFYQHTAIAALDNGDLNDNGDAVEFDITYKAF